jgi:erythronate-4-phosphate dehydrogenase
MQRNSVKIIVEGNIPYFKGLLDDVAHVEYLAPQDITPAAVKDADALVTRTRTRCDSALLAGSRCSLIASATIGLDHVDTAWCEANGITVRNAPGCNAPAVAQYVFASLLSFGHELEGRTLGIVGAGHVGAIVADWGVQLGMNVIVCDPPRAEREGRAGFVTMEDIARRADFITFHTPYNKGGEHPTHHLLDSSFVDSLAKSPVVINSARGAVTDTSALLHGLETGRISSVVIDCWEGEPEIDRELLEKAAVATPHIAGYSKQGKIRAARMAAEAVATRFGLPLSAGAPMQYLPSRVTAQDIASSYNPATDTAALKAYPQDFEKLRNNYNLRREVLFNEPIHC